MKMITSQIIGAENVAKGISKILTALLSKDIQLQYSACGRETCGQKKMSFCDTHTFKCMRGILFFPVITQKDILFFSSSLYFLENFPFIYGLRKIL